MRVLFLNHTSRVSGAERSMLTLLAGLPDEVSSAMACPAGPLAESVGELGVPVLAVPEVSGSLRLHPWHTARALIDIGQTAVALRRHARNVQADVVHANSIRAGVAAVLASRLGGPPAVVHVHDRLPPGPASSLVLRTIASGAGAVLACSAYAAEQLTSSNGSVLPRVVHNPVNIESFRPGVMSAHEARARLGLEPETVVLAVVAQITPWKGQDDAIRIAARLKRGGRDIRLLLIGSPKFVSKATRYDNLAFARGLEELIESLDLGDQVLFLGEREDIPELMRAVDVVLVPSWEEPFGMSVIEAMAMELPVVATAVGGVAEVITHRENGLLLPPRQPETWAGEVERLIGRPELRLEMGRRARERVAHELNVRAYTERIMAAYSDVLSSRWR
jgi:glycosyltransferase involved in cell wall biosynthesis